MESKLSDTATASSTAGLFELVLEVADLDRSERFYRDAVGLTLANRWGSDPNDSETRQAVFLEIGPHAFLGLWPPETGGENALAGGRGGTHVHFALLVPYGSLEALRERLIMHGIEIVLDRDFGNGNHAIYISDPDGNVVELTERRTDWAGDLVGVTPTVKGIAPR